jgi:hypothetical protein
MRDSTYKLGTYDDKPTANAALRSAEYTAAGLRERVRLTFDVTQSSRGWVACVSGTTADVEAFKKAWE